MDDITARLIVISATILAAVTAWAWSKHLQNERRAMIEDAQQYDPLIDPDYHPTNDDGTSALYLLKRKRKNDEIDSDTPLDELFEGIESGNSHSALREKVKQFEKDRDEWIRRQGYNEADLKRAKEVERLREELNHYRQMLDRAEYEKAQRNEPRRLN
jgi:hypothetical protein